MNEMEFYLEDLASKFAKINPSEYCLSYSGGRDSHFLLWFIKEYLKEPRIEIVATNTGMEHKEIMERMLANADTVLKPAMPHFQIKEKHGSPCFSKRQDQYIHTFQNHIKNGKTYDDMPDYIKWTVYRKPEYDPKGMNRLSQIGGLSKYASELAISGKLHPVSDLCCKYLKKKPAYLYEKETGKKAILGVMGEESKARAGLHSKQGGCFNKKGTFYPILDLTADLRDRIEKAYNIPVPKIYQYTHQTGCVGCPYGIYKFDSTSVNLELNLQTEARREFILEYFKESYAVKKYTFQKELIV